MSSQKPGRFDLSPQKRELLERLRQQKPGADSSRIPRRAATGPAPLSFAQQRLWFLDQLDPGNPAYNLSGAVRLEGTLDVPAIGRALEAIVARHESLRTTFAVVDGRPVQRISPVTTVPLPLEDLRRLPPGEREAEARRLAAVEARRPFALDHGPLLRAILLKLNEDDHVLLLTLHHIVSDGWSRGVFTRELALFYQAFRQGEAPALRELEIQYADFAAWQRERLQGARLEEQLGYWRKELDGLAPLALLTDRSRPAIQTHRGGTHVVRFPPALAEGLAAVGRREGATAFMVLLAGFKLLLHRLTGLEDIAVGSPIANRNRSEVEGLIGFFVNSLVMRTDLSGDPSFRELLGRVRKAALGAYDHQDLPFEKLVDELQPGRDLGQNPLFQVMFAVQNAPASALELPGLILQPFAGEEGFTRFDLEVHAFEAESGSGAMFRYNADLFDAATVELWGRHWLALLEGAVERPEAKIGDLPLLREDEKEGVLALGRGRELLARSYHPTTRADEIFVQEAFRVHALRTPAALAVSGGAKTLTYGELDRRSNQLARYLKRLGVGPDARVGVCAERSVETVIGLLGVLKVGGAYVAMDPAYPKAQLEYVVADAGVKVLLTQERLRDRLPEGEARVLSLDRDWGAIAQESEEPIDAGVSLDNLAYVIYTSGSTGRPKGVEIPHRGLWSLVRWHQSAYGVQEIDRATLIAGPAFDASVWELWPYLTSGASVHIPDEETRLSPGRLQTWLVEEGITLSFLPTALAELLLKQEGLDALFLRVLLTGGDKLHALGERELPCRVVNHYGPTECSVVATCGEVEAGDSDPSIGRAIDDARVYVLDRQQNLVPIGFPGELCIAGEGLARGYLGRPDLTAERFVPDAFAANPGARMYRTGDLVRYRGDGQLEFLGRIDQQVKVRGFRIELGEVETALLRHPEVKDAVVVTQAEGETAQRLVAYVVPDRGPREGLDAAPWQGEHVAQWQALYEETYTEAGTAADPTFAITGWNSSYTGRPLPEEEMREWVEQTAERILALGPRRVLEIGCGTGLLLSRIAPSCERYVATDFSGTALAHVREGILASRDWKGVELLQRTAEDFEGIAAGEFDLVILNSVVQYFPGVDYLVRVLQGAVRATRPEGYLFVGDVRNLRLLEAFHASVQSYQAAPSLPVEELGRRVRDHVLREKELVLAPSFFSALKSQVPEIGGVLVQPKRGVARNELVAFRYDAILRVGSEVTGTAVPWVDWEEERLNVDALRERLRELNPDAFGLAAVSNRRVWGAVGVARALARGDALGELAGRSSALGRGAGDGIDPEELWVLGRDLSYEVEISWLRSGPEGRFDVAFRRTGGAPGAAVFPGADSSFRSWSEYANDPLRARSVEHLVPRLRGHLEQALPGHMVPAVIVVLEALPLTPNGKVDRRALPTPYDRPELEEGYVEPRSPVEEELARIWAQVLGVLRVGIRDNFFELGGDSILSMQIIARANQAGLRLTPKQIFQAQTIAELARVVGTGAAVEAEQGLVRGPVPLTPIQSWLFEQELEEAHHFNQALLLEVRGGVSPEILAEAVKVLEEHHDALRLRFGRTGPAWGQEVTLPGAAVFARVDLSTIGVGEQRAAIEKVAAEVQGSLSLEGPLWRVVWMDLGAGGRSRLLVVIHHLAVDGVSWRVLLEDLERVCGQLGRGESARLPAKTTSFKEWSEKLTVYAGSEELKGELPYWCSVVSDGSKALPVDGLREGGRVEDTGRVIALLDAEETKALLQEVPGAYHSQVTDVLLLALVRSLAEWTGERSLVLDLEGHGREEVFEGMDLSRTVGWFTSLFPMRVTLSDGGDVGEDLKLVKEQVRSVPGRGMGYGALRYLGGEGASLATTRGAEVSFNYLGRFEQGQDEVALFGSARESAGEARSPKTKRRYLLELNGLVANGRFSLTWTYSKKAHRLETIEGLVERFERELRGIIVHCLSEGAGGHTPSDFPLARLDQEALDRVLGGQKDVEDVYPLSPMQEGILFHCLLNPETPVYFEQLSMELHGDLDAPSMARAWQQVLDRHPVLRTRFAWEGLARPVQVVERRPSLDWEERDLRGLGEREQREALDRILAADLKRGLDPSKAPLTRVLLVRTGEEAHRLVWDFHHLSLDGWCLPLVFKEMSASYEAFRSGRRPELPSVPAYRDYIAWLQKQDLVQAEQYWRRYLAGVRSSTPLPLDQAPDRVREGSMDMGGHAFQISGPVTTALKALGRQHRLTLNTIVLGAWALVLGRYSSESDVVFGATVSGRPASLPGVESMVGLLINTLPLRVRISPEKSLLTWLEELQAQQVEQRQYEFSPLVKVQGWSEVPPGQPLFESILAFENYPGSVSAGSLGKVGEVRYHSRSNYPIAITAGPGPRLTFRITYVRGRFDEHAITRIEAYLTEILEAMAKDATRTLLELPGLASGEREQVLAWSGHPKSPAGETFVHELFGAHVQRTPLAIAVSGGGKTLTYGELDRRSNQLARHLRGLGVGPEARVGVCAERSVETVIGLLGVLKAGGAYVAMDPAHPKPQLEYVAADAGVKVLLTQERLRDRLPEGEVRVLSLDRDWGTIAQEDEEPIDASVTLDNLAYVIYTSGSTGRPKGVEIPHRGLSSLVRWHQAAYGVQEGDRATLLAGPAFDASVWELWPYLTSGASVHVPDEETRLSPERLESWLGEEGITLSFLPTALAELLLKQEGLDALSLRVLLTGGDKLHPLGERVPPFRVVNHYGPTECSVVATGGDVEAGDTDPSIGRAIDGTRVYVLDRQQNLAPIGAPGELYIAGEGLARGYLGRPDLTAERFVPDAFAATPGARMYRTGDLVRYRGDGQLEFLGRIDQQVKIRGFRIELGEVESVLRRHPAVREAIVVAGEDGARGKRLVAYVVSDDPEVDALELAGFLRERLPDYMVPSAFVSLSALPLTTSGKVDRGALPAPESSGYEALRGLVEPRTPAEERVAAIWREVLQRERVGVQDNFFDVGGHSLLLVQVHGRLREAFPESPLPIVDLFRYPTIESLAAHLSSPRASDPASNEAAEAEAERRIEGRQRLGRRRGARQVVVAEDVADA